MKNLMFTTFLLITLTACASAQANPADVQNTAIAFAWTDYVLTQTALPTATPPPPTFTPTATFVEPTPSRLPTQRIFPMMTPNAIQIERWREYEDALGEAFFRSYFSPEEVVCEWEIMGQTDWEVYVYAHCAGIYSANPSEGSIPAVIHIRSDGSVKNAEIPGAGTSYGPDIRRMFPPYVQERIFVQPRDFIGSEAYWRTIARGDRLRWRQGHPNEPPWIILNSLAIQPTQPIIPLITPDPNQIARWEQYQMALAEKFSYHPPEKVICEWEILGQSSNEVYVWAICGEKFGIGGLEGLAIFHHLENGAVQYVEIPGLVISPSEVREMFPLEVQERYFGGLIHFQELVDHLRWRQRHPEEPPLFFSTATPTATPTP